MGAGFKELNKERASSFLRTDFKKYKNNALSLLLLQIVWKIVVFAGRDRDLLVAIYTFHL